MTYNIDKNNRFIIEDFNRKKPFASFLPGIAGEKGIPMWVFYTNRGQAVCSIGVKDKNGAIMEFNPAYKSYQTVENTGFRTFFKIDNGSGEQYYEPFTNATLLNKRSSKMFVGANECEIEEISEDFGIKTNVLYFTLPEEEVAALVRVVNIENISEKDMTLEVLDGVPSIIPFGIENEALKAVGHTLKAWMCVYNLENNLPLYKLKASSSDSAEITEIEEAHYYIGFEAVNDKLNLLKPLIDMDTVFGANTSFSFPQHFINKSLELLLNSKQVNMNKIPGAFVGTKRTLKQGEKITLISLLGHIDDINRAEEIKSKVSNTTYIMNKYERAKGLARELTNNIETNTASKVFDEYCRQTYLDNVLRGGYPVVLKEGETPIVYHIYSRKHGDLERDYNFFSTEPEYYSCGNGNFRDVNQNRRCDIYFNPKIKDFNVKTFMDLIQIDGYNPLVLNGYKFVFSGDITSLKTFVNDDKLNILQNFLRKPFTLGKLYSFINNNSISESMEDLVEVIIHNCHQEMDAVFGEGYWVDHWTYNLDLVESYLEIYPEDKERLLFDTSYTYFDGYAFVRPRHERYVYNKGKIRQYEAIEHNKEKEEFINKRERNKNILRTKNGQGDIYKSNLIEKLIVLAVNKYSSLDPMGMGIEMEAGKPGWNDALNGLPGLFGSSMADSYELMRLIEFIIENSTDFLEKNIKLPVEIYELLERIYFEVNVYNRSSKMDRDFIYWDKVNKEKEKFREKIKFGISGEERVTSLKSIVEIFDIIGRKLHRAINRALEENHGIYPTYFCYEAVDYEFIRDENGENKVNVNGYPLVKINEFKQVKMPLFLEGVVRGLKIQKSREKCREIICKVKESTLYDKKLKMYKLNENLDSQSFEIGRLRAFTPGWLENETIWLHMEYKYLLEIMKCGLYDEYFEEIKTTLIPFLDSEVYGRSILENSSFIASSANPDEATHGVGYVARLSGAAAEFLSMWQYMMVGQSPFSIEQGELNLKFSPAIPGWLFDQEGTVNFNFLSNIKVSYCNPKKEDTNKLKINKIVLNYKDGAEVILDSDIIPSPYASDVRNNLVKEIKIKLV